MKRIIILSIIFLVIGFLIGNYIFSKYSNNYFQNNYYLLQEGVYYNLDNVNDNKKLIIKDNDKYYVYVAITRDLDVLNKLKRIYKDKGYNLIQKEKEIDSKAFASNIKEFDSLIKSAEDTNSILTIEEVVLASFQEIMKNKY